MADLEIIGAPMSNFVWTCRIAAEEKGVPYTLTPAMPHTPPVDAWHPTGKIPAMRHGDFGLGESKAIATYIDRAFPGPALIPADPQGAATVEQWVSIVNTFVDPVCMRQYVVGYVFPGTPDGSPNRAGIEAAVAKMPPQLAMLETAVAKGGYLAGAGFTLADAFLVPILYYLAKFPEGGEMLRGHPPLSAYFHRMMQRPSIAKTVPPPMPGR